jgi:uncharacterized protein with PIN domain
MENRPFNVVERKDLMPVCPHCSKELGEVYRKSVGVALIVGTNTVYFCPHCRKVLGLGQSRML